MAINALVGALQVQTASEPASKQVDPVATGRPPTSPPTSPPNHKASRAEAQKQKETEAARLEREMKAAEQQFNDFMERHSIKMRFSVDPDTKEVVVKVLHAQSGELIRQVPTEEALKLAKELDSQQGVIVQTKA